MLTALVYLQQENVKKSKELIKRVNIHEKKFIFSDRIFQEKCVL